MSTTSSTSVGTRVELEHTRASRVGVRIEVTATPVFHDGRLHRFSVVAREAGDGRVVGITIGSLETTWLPTVGTPSAIRFVGARSAELASGLHRDEARDALVALPGLEQGDGVQLLVQPGAPVVDAIVEELFPLEATKDLHAFFGAADDADLGDRMNRMVASTSAFGANRDVDTVPTSRYVMRSPFTSEPSR